MGMQITPLSLLHSDYMKVKKLTDMKAFFSRSGVQWPELEWINTDSLLSTNELPAVPIDEPALHFTPSKLCFLQYTSGSTSLPKVCVISNSKSIPSINPINHYHYHVHNHNHNHGGVIG